MRVMIACAGALRHQRGWTVSRDFLVKITISAVVLISAQSLKNHVPLLGGERRCRGRIARLRRSGAMFWNRLPCQRLTGSHLNSNFSKNRKSGEKFNE
jgi:hypothetical protein